MNPGSGLGVILSTPEVDFQSRIPCSLLGVPSMLLRSDDELRLAEQGQSKKFTSLRHVCPSGNFLVTNHAAMATENARVRHRQIVLLLPGSWITQEIALVRSHLIHGGISSFRDKRDSMSVEDVHSGKHSGSTKIPEQGGRDVLKDLKSISHVPTV